MAINSHLNTEGKQNQVQLCKINKQIKLISNTLSNLILNQLFCHQFVIHSSNKLRRRFCPLICSERCLVSTVTIQYWIAELTKTININQMYIFVFKICTLKKHNNELLTTSHPDWDPHSGMRNKNIKFPHKTLIDIELQSVYHPSMAWWKTMISRKCEWGDPLA